MIEVQADTETDKTSDNVTAKEEEKRISLIADHVVVSAVDTVADDQPTDKEADKQAVQQLEEDVENTADKEMEESPESHVEYSSFLVTGIDYTNTRYDEVEDDVPKRKPTPGANYIEGKVLVVPY